MADDDLAGRSTSELVDMLRGIPGTPEGVRVEQLEAQVRELRDLLIEARGLTAGLAADLLDYRARSARVGEVHDFHERLRVALSETGH